MKQQLRAQYTAEIREVKQTVVKKLKSEIVFGSPSTGCQGSGVCKVVPVLTSATELKCPHATAWISITRAGMLRFAFQRSSLTEKEIKRYFRWQLFQVFEPFPMPPFVLRKLNAPNLLIIRPGIYPVRETPQELVVEFRTDAFK